MNVLKPWTQELTLQMQGSLLCGIRGPDGMTKDDVCKPLVRAMRAVITNNALPLGPDNSFAGDGSGYTADSVVNVFIYNLDKYNVHWLSKFMLCAEIIGYCHPDILIRSYWINVYMKLCDHFHVSHEFRDRLLARLDGNGT